MFRWNWEPKHSILLAQARQEALAFVVEFSGSLVDFVDDGVREDVGVVAHAGNLPRYLTSRLAAGN